jgi:hypothetical protein
MWNILVKVYCKSSLGEQLESAGDEFPGYKKRKNYYPQRTREMGRPQSSLLRLALTVGRGKSWIA